MSLRDKLGVFLLTKEEQRTVAFVILMVALGLITKHYRNRHPERATKPNEITHLARP
jgi:hypothetical protein